MKLIKISLFLFILGIFSSLTLFAADEGSHTAEFLSHGVGARALGMGSAFVAIADDATATYWNPAGLTKVKKHSFSAMYSDTFSTGDGSFLSKGLVSYNFVNYVHQLEGIGSLGLSWIRLGIDDIPRTTFIDVDNNGFLGDFQDINGNGTKDEGEPYIDRPTVAEYFSNTDNALLISYARQIHPIVAVGGNLKLLSQSIFENSGRGFGIDIGIILMPYKGFRFGTILLDATGTQIRWDTADKPVFTRGRRLRFGGAYQWTFPSFGKGSISADFETDQADLEEGTDSGGGFLFRTGAEYWLFRTLALRCGWNGHGFSAGTGLQLRVSTMTFFVDYAFNTHTLGGSQRISVSGQF
ncbi:MAG: PorV/PorQ family protein [Candidatus Poribacteria bacterium]|nr:PorV/PorQ family protein [Candidatus Poribacteria bacterium]